MDRSVILDLDETVVKNATAVLKKLKKIELEV
jgi:predicted secreted acid phosphatase